MKLTTINQMAWERARKQINEFDTDLTQLSDAELDNLHQKLKDEDNINYFATMEERDRRRKLRRRENK